MFLCFFLKPFFFTGNDIYIYTYIYQDPPNPRKSSGVTGNMRFSRVYPKYLGFCPETSGFGAAGHPASPYQDWKEDHQDQHQHIGT